MLVNFSNHLSSSWSSEQTLAAKEYGPIVDLPFPNVSPELDEDNIFHLAEAYVETIKELKPTAVICQGEMTLAHTAIRMLCELGITVMAACSERNTEESTDVDGNTAKTVRFQFVKFRKYVY